jgi:hypothetical protein
MERYGTRMRSTFYYGPWQCNGNFMGQCQRECAAQGRVLKGCMWLADIKYDFQAQTMFLPLPIQAGSRYAIWHCCCDFVPLKTADKEVLRRQWEGATKSIRRRFAEEYGDWPSTGGANWPGHHVRDLKHGGHPTDLGNIFPAQPEIHAVFTKQYPACYAGMAPWNTPGPALPYKDW